MEKTFNYKGTIINIDNYSHINVNNRATCLQECSNKTCTYLCPAHVFWWREDIKEIEVRYWQCLECGLCLIICSKNNIEWIYPRGGYGVKYRF